MSDHVDVADSVLKSSQRYRTFGRILDWVRGISRVVNSVIVYPSVLLNPSSGHSLVAMASVDPIDISSTDSDSDFREIDNYIAESPDKDVTSSTNPRNLATWTSSAHPNLTDYSNVSRKSPYSFSPSSQRKVVHDIHLRPLKQLNSAEIVGPSTFNANGNVHQRLDLSNYGGYGTSCEMISSQPKRRAISSGLQTSISGMGLNNPIENVGRSEIRETFGTFNQLGTWSHASNGRQLPLSLMPGQKPSTSPYVGLNDSFHHTELGEEGRAGADERFVFQAAVQDLHQPKVEATLPDGLLTVPLLRHQKIALAWMLSKESSGLCLGGILADDQGLGKTVSMIALIQMQRTLEAKSKSKCNYRTEALNLDDDDDGNGGCVALDDPGQVDGSGEIAVLPEGNNALKGFQSRRPMAGTLIVCPASVIRQWARELREKVYYKAKLQVLTYHGPSRTKDPAVLAENDVVLTTYAIVTNEVPKQPSVDEDDDVQNDGERNGLSSAFFMEKKRKKSSCNKKHKKGKREIDVSSFDGNCGTLAKVKWSRVVLDESQMIKNHRTQVARACCSLRAKRRWCLSGTPMQNSIDELFSYFRFLRYDPYDKYKTFSSSIKGLIAKDSAKGYKKLQVVLRNIMLRRTKGTLLDGEPIITLPPKQIHLTRVEFSLEERAFYDKLEADSRKQFKAYAAAGTVNQNYANILLMLLRLRQACDHPLLVKGSSSDPVGKDSSEMAKILPRELLVNLWKQLETSLAICLACRDPPENAVVTMCGHVFCYQCVSDSLTGEDNTCPAPECKEQLGADIVYSRSTLRRCLSDYIDGDGNVSFELDEKCFVLRRDYISSKIRCALDILKSHCISKRQSPESPDLVIYDGDASSSSGVQSSSESGGREKAIVFSQWTSMLDLVEMSLKNSGISYRRLDGTMSIAARDKAVKDFNTDTEVDVMLMSLKAGNLGLNMVAACRIILLDLWWNPTTEDQAIDRAHRIGQTRPVTVSRITIKDTVEDRILTLQDDKRKMVASAFGEDQTGGHGTRLTVDDLRFLFEGSKASRR